MVLIGCLLLLLVLLLVVLLVTRQTSVPHFTIPILSPFASVVRASYIPGVFADCEQVEHESSSVSAKAVVVVVLGVVVYCKVVRPFQR
jgi:hypothetical protein